MGLPGLTRGVADRRYKAQNNRYRFTSANLPKWQKAVTLVRGGSRDAKLLCAGDSVTTGASSSTNATIPAIKSYPARLQELLNSYMVPAACGLAIPTSSIATTVDQRWTLGAGWAESNSANNLGFGAKAHFTATSPAGDLVFADNRVNADSFDVYFIANTGSGSYTVTATGGTPVVVNLATGPNGFKKVTVTAGSAATTNTVTISSATGGVCVNGIEPFLSTTTKVRVGNAGVGSTTAANWAHTGTVAGFGAPGAIAAYAPDLTILCLGINDAIASTSAASYLASLQTVITAAQLSGDVVLLSMPPSNDATAISFEPLYVAAMAGLTTLPFADLFTRAGSYSAWNTAGYMADQFHPNDFGYLDMAQAVFAGLRDV